MKLLPARHFWFAPILFAATVVTAVACGPSDAPDVSEKAANSPTASSAATVEPPTATPTDLPTTSAPALVTTVTPATPIDPALPAEPTQPNRTNPTAPPMPTNTRTDTRTDTRTNTPTPEPTDNPTDAAPPTPALLSDDWEKELRTSAINRAGWKTDFSRRSVPYTEIFSGGVPRDGIPPIDNPKFVPVGDADGWLEDQEPVISFEQDGEAKAYPLQILTYHEIVNDTVAGVPVAATFCPLCNSAIVFERRLDGVVYDFGVSGNLRNSDLIMWDRQTESWWQQLTGEAIVGELTGKRLPILPATIVAWQDFQTTYPDGLVLSRDTGHFRDYGTNPYVGYDEIGQSPFLFFGKEDERLQPTERVAALTAGDEAVAFPFSFLEEVGVAHHSIGGRNLVIFFKPGSRSALDGWRIADSREVGSTGIFERELEGQLLTFKADGNGFVDEETGSLWNIFGQATAGPHLGKKLVPVAHANHFWFAWAAFRPDTRLVQ